jgi:hypothetical protein
MNSDKLHSLSNVRRRGSVKKRLAGREATNCALWLFEILKCLIGGQVTNLELV